VAAPLDDLRHTMICGRLRFAKECEQKSTGDKKV
jgi:hypothetical protein